MDAGVKKDTHHDTARDDAPEVAELKVIMLGDCGVGKSTVIYRLHSGKFDPNRRNVIVCDFMRKNVEVDGITYRLCLWDTVGQERFAVLHHTYFRAIVALVFALNDEDSFANIGHWLTEVLTHRDLTDPASFPFVLIGNKSDLSAAVVSQEDIAAWCRDHYNMPYYQCSAKTGEGVTEAFTAAVARYASLPCPDHTHCSTCC